MTGFTESVHKETTDKDQRTMKFDWEAEEIVIDYCKKMGFPVKILSEERGEVLVGTGKPQYVLIVDPVDGSTNFKRGVEATAFCISAIPANKPLTAMNVEHALIGSIWTGSIFSAQKGKGAFNNGKRCSTSAVKTIEEALIGIDFDFAPPHLRKRIIPVTKKCYMVRRAGVAGLDAAFVCSGAYDAMIDIRDRSTPENFMAASLIVSEAGGILTDPFGNDLPAIDIRKTYNWVASGNRELHRQIIDALDMSE